MTTNSKESVSIVSDEIIDIAYKCRWQDKPVFLIVRGEAKCNDLHPSLFAAAVLGEIETACVLLETVLNTGFDFGSYSFLQSSIIQYPDIADYVRARLTIGESADRLHSRELEICLPISALVDADIDQLAEHDVKWQPIDGMLRISNIDLTEEDKSRLFKNSVLLIPESFQSVWRCALELSSVNVVVDAKYDFTTRAVYSERVQLSTPQNRFLQIYVDGKIVISPPALLSRKSIEWVSDFDLNLVGKCQCVCTDGSVYDAQLLSMGAGYAVCLGENSSGTH